MPILCYNNLYYTLSLITEHNEHNAYTNDFVQHYFYHILLLTTTEMQFK